VRRWSFALAGCLLLVVGWEIGAYLVGGRSDNPEIVWPHLSQVIGEALPALAMVDTTGGQQLSATAEPSVAGALEMLSGQAWVTTLRVLAGSVLGLAIGVALGALLALVRPFRWVFAPLLSVLRQVPLFSLTLLFVIWFGGSTLGIVTFVTFGAALMIMVATQEAILGVPDLHVRYARTLGASRLDVVRTVIAPAVVPAVAATLLVVLGLAWAMVMAAEFLGTQQGLGRLLLFFQTFQLTDRMVVVTGVLTVLAAVSQIALARLFARLTRWVPREA
jgi:ABC-type nitrate/sulfonate/bicarbonate transport system permease component